MFHRTAITLLVACLGCSCPSRGDDLPASDWITTGSDCKIFAAGDVDGDGFVDLITINGNRDLAWSPSVNGWKAGSWRVLAGDLNPDAVGLTIVVGKGTTRVVVLEKDRAVVVPIAAPGKGEAAKGGERVVVTAESGVTFTGVIGDGEAVFQDASGKVWKLTPQNTLVVAETSGSSANAGSVPHITKPPYDAAAQELCRFASGFSPKGGRLAWTAFATTMPHPHVAVRYAVLASPDPLDADADGLTDEEEAAIGTDPHNRDTDDDGLLDGWEVHGFPAGRLTDLGPRLSLYDAKAMDAAKDRQLDPRRKDVIVSISYFDQVDRKQFEGEMSRIEAVYRGLNVTNPDGTKGVWLHLRELAAGVTIDDQKMAWWDVGNKYFARRERGLGHWLQVTPWGGGQSSETGDMGGCGNNWAVFAHELGHQLSLSHTGDSAPGWCPLYPSLMNYAYSYSFDGDGAKPHFSSGEFRVAVLDERHLREKLPFPAERLKFLTNRPFRFTIKDNGDGTTLIDWNHNGVFDEGEVVADINYGGSTQAGERMTHTMIGSSPSLAYIGDKCFLAASTHKQTAVTIKMQRGTELAAADQWTPEREIPSSSSRCDPVLIGGPDFGVVLVRRFDSWSAAMVRADADAMSAPKVSPLQPLPDLLASDVSGIRIGERVLLLARHDSGKVEVCWLMTEGGGTAKDAIFTMSELKPLTLSSMVPPGLAVNPVDGTITVVSSARHEKHGPFTMQVSTLVVSGEDVTETPPSWTHGGRPCHCTSRPVPVYPTAVGGAKPTLTIFHTGWTDGGGLWTGWRTTKVDNTALDDGWLTSQLYDEWTRSRVAIGFADGPHGAFYAFRWDCGDHRDWKTNTMFVAHGGYGIDEQPMRDFDDGAKIGQWGIRHSILTMPTDAEIK